MNCQRFQDELLEYVEGTLSADARTAAEQHLATCNACRQAVEKEKRLAHAMSSRLLQSTETLSLRPEIRRNILAASRQKATSPTVAESIAALLNYWLRLAAVPASLLVVAVVLLAIHFYAPREQKIVSVPIAPRVSTTTPPVGQNPQPAVSVQMSYRLPTHQFHQEENVVVDTLVNETVVASGTFQPGSKEPISPQMEMKIPL